MQTNDVIATDYATGKLLLELRSGSSDHDALRDYAPATYGLFTLHVLGTDLIPRFTRVHCLFLLPPQYGEYGYLLTHPLQDIIPYKTSPLSLL